MLCADRGPHRKHAFKDELSKTFLRWPSSNCHNFRRMMSVRVPMGWCYDPCRLSFCGRSLFVTLLGNRNLFAATQVMIRARSPLIKQKKTCLAIAGCLLMLSGSSSFGQYVSVIQTCSRDVAQFCAPDRRGGSPLTECVKTHFGNFSEPCKAALVRIAVVREACGADIQEHCPAVKPGAGRIFLCVKRHFPALSGPCKEAIGKAAERK
jgi:hypothetical protein